MTEPSASRSCGSCRGPATSTPTAISSAAGCSARWTSPPASSPRAEAKGPVATVAIEAMEFIAPILLRDLISVYAEVERIGRTSIAIRIEVIASRDRGTTEVKVTEGLFTFVALDEEHRPRAGGRGLVRILGIAVQPGDRPDRVGQLRGCSPGPPPRHNASRSLTTQALARTDRSVSRRPELDLDVAGRIGRSTDRVGSVARASGGLSSLSL